MYAILQVNLFLSGHSSTDFSDLATRLAVILESGRQCQSVSRHGAQSVTTWRVDLAFIINDTFFKSCDCI